MQIKEVINSLNLQLLTHTGDMQAEVTGGYASDLLSNVMGQAEPGMVGGNVPGAFEPGGGKAVRQAGGAEAGLVTHTGSLPFDSTCG